MGPFMVLLRNSIQDSHSYVRTYITAQYPLSLLKTKSLALVWL